MTTMARSFSPKISVVLPVYNGEDYLTDCISSVLDQDQPEFELLIGDDGSTDSSRQVIQAIQDERVRTFFNSHNLGLFGNINRLLAEARAPLIHILCQDDLLEPNCLHSETRFFESHPEIGMSFVKAIIIDEEGEKSRQDD